MKKDIKFFNTEIQESIFALSEKYKGRLRNILEILEIYPDDFQKISKYVVQEEKGLLKIKLNEIRIFFVISHQDIVLLHLFEKKSQKTPKKDLEKARNRKKEVERQLR